MMRHKSWRQPDLFGTSDAIAQMEPMSAEFIARIRGELMDTLAMARNAEALPWRDLTSATLAELRFNSIAGWLSADEAAGLRESFGREMLRLYALAEKEAAEADAE